MSTDYSDILLTTDGDIDLTSEDAIFISTNLDSLRQRLNIRYAVWQGEWKYNELLGTPYREYIGKSFNKATIDSEIKRQALLEPDVERLDNFKSAFDKNIRLYSCSFVVETNEGSVSYGLVLRDSFNYVIPNYTTSCDKIIRYQYVTSKPYYILDKGYLESLVIPRDGIVKEQPKETESTDISLNINNGTLRDILQQDTHEEYIDAGSAIMSMTLTSTLSPNYNAGIEYMSGSSTITGGVLTTILVPYVHPTEDYAASSSAITSMTLTG